MLVKELEELHETAGPDYATGEVDSKTGLETASITDSVILPLSVARDPRLIVRRASSMIPLGWDFHISWKRIFMCSF